MNTYKYQYKGGLQLDANGGLGAVLGFYTIVIFVVYIAQAVSLYLMSRKAGYRRPWLSFIPLVSFHPYFWTIRISNWNFLWLLAPLLSALVNTFHPVGSLGVSPFFWISELIQLVFVAVGIWWWARLFIVFGFSPHWLWFLLLPVIGFVIVFGIELSIGLRSDIKYTYRYD